MQRNNKGMSLLEILVAIALLAVVAIPLGRFFIGSVSFQAKNQKLSQDGEVASFIVEQLKNGNGTNYLSNATSTFKFSQFCSGIGATNNFGRDFNVKLESTKISEAVSSSGNFISMPDTYNGVVKVSNSGITYSGDISVTVDGKTVTINNIYGSSNNKLKIENETSVFPEINLKNLSSTSLNVYKDKDILVNVLTGNINQINLNSSDNNVYNLYKIKVTVTEVNDNTISNTLDTTIKVLDNLK